MFIIYIFNVGETFWFSHWWWAHFTAPPPLRSAPQLSCNELSFPRQLLPPNIRFSLPRHMFREVLPDRQPKAVPTTPVPVPADNSTLPIFSYRPYSLFCSFGCCLSLPNRTSAPWGQGLQLTSLHSIHMASNSTQHIADAQ